MIGIVPVVVAAIALAGCRPSVNAPSMLAQASASLAVSLLNNGRILSRRKGDDEVIRCTSIMVKAPRNNRKRSPESAKKKLSLTLRAHYFRPVVMDKSRSQYISTEADNFDIHTFPFGQIFGEFSHRAPLCAETPQLHRYDNAAFEDCSMNRMQFQ
jgi:hypothetical protein